MWGSSAGILSSAACTTKAGEVVGTELLQRALVGPADGGAGGGNDHCFGHGFLQWSRAGVWQWPRQAPVGGPDAPRRHPSRARSGTIGACATSTGARCGGPTSTCCGHVNNVIYVDYLQEARVDMFRVHAPGSDRAGDLAEGVVVVRHEVDLRSPLAFDARAPVRIECWVTEIRAAIFTIAYEVFAEDAAGPHRLPAGQHRADAVRLRDRAAASAHRRGAGGSRARTSSPRRAGAPRRPTPVRAAAARGALPGARALLRRRRLRPRQQREVLRVLPGGPDRADVAARRAA